MAGGFASTPEARRHHIRHCAQNRSQPVADEQTSQACDMAWLHQQRARSPHDSLLTARYSIMQR